MNWKFSLICGWLCLASGMTSASSQLESALLKAVQAAHFDQVLDFGAGMEDKDIPAGSARRIAHTPHVDVAVIQLDTTGQAIASANVLLSRDYPQGVIVPTDIHRGAWQVRFQPWNIDRWNGGVFPPGALQPQSEVPWAQAGADQASRDSIRPVTGGEKFEFMSPYPASLFKLLIAFHLFQRVDQGAMTIDAPITFEHPPGTRETRTLIDWMDPMITQSDNRSTQALLQWMHQQGQIEALNAGFRRLGLHTLQVNGTRALDGRGWQPGQIHMTAYDTARLLWLIQGGPGSYWKTPDGHTITRDILSESSRSRLKQLLLDQALHEILSTSVLAGHPQVQPGIPARVPHRWIHPTRGSVSVAGVDFGMDIREPNQKAQVTFAHKTGLTYNYASDAGIVESLPQHPPRRYIIAFFSNLGYRYADEMHRHRTRGPYADPVSPIACTQRIPALGKALDEELTRTSSR